MQPVLLVSSQRAMLEIAEQPILLGADRVGTCHLDGFAYGASVITEGIGLSVLEVVEDEVVPLGMSGFRDAIGRAEVNEELVKFRMQGGLILQTFPTQRWRMGVHQHDAIVGRFFCPTRIPCGPIGGAGKKQGAEQKAKREKAHGRIIYGDPAR